MEDDGGCRSPESHAPRGHFIEHRSKAEKIGPSVQFFAASLLGRHVRNGPHCHSRAGERFLGSHSLKRFSRGSGSVAVRGQLRQTEIHQLRLVARGDENVGGLNVAVNDAFSVRSVERLRDLNTDIQECIRWESAPFDALLEGFTLEQFHHQKKSSLVFLNLVNGADVGVIQRGSGTCFAAEALQRLRVLVEFFREKFERHTAAKLEIFGGVEHTHAAAPELFQNAVMRESLADHYKECRCAK